MPEKPIDLDALERVLGPPPRRYAKGSPHNRRRHDWYNRASAAIGALVQRNDVRYPPRDKRERDRLYRALINDSIRILEAHAPPRHPTNPEK